MSDGKKSREEKGKEHAKEVAEALKKSSEDHVVSNDHDPEGCRFCQENLRKSVENRLNQISRKRKGKDLLPLQKVTIFDVKNDIKNNKEKWTKKLIENYPHRKNDEDYLFEIALCSYWLGLKLNRYNVSAPCQYDMCLELSRKAFRDYDVYTSVVNIWNQWCDEEGMRTGKTVFSAPAPKSKLSDIPYLAQASEEEIKRKVLYLPILKKERKVKEINTKHHVDLVKKYKIN